MNGRGGAFDPQGPVAETIAELWWLMLALGVAVYLVVVVLLAVGLFRRRSSDPGEEGDEVSSRRWLVWGGLVLPVALITVVLVATVGAMRAVRNDVPSGALVIDIVGHQWWWEVRYPDEDVTTANELHIPVGRPVALRLRSADVIHSLWIPRLAGKLDVMPDGANTLVLQADEPGEHSSECAEFCGLQHAQMAMTVIVEPAGRFGSWIRDQQRPAAKPADRAAQRGADVV